MADTVIDSLVVTLGLNAQGFQDAVNKAGTSVAGLAKHFAGTFLAIQGFGDAIKYAVNLNKELTDLSFTAQNLGLHATELSRWGEVARLAGGNAEDAAASFQSLTSAVMGLRFQGQMSPQLMALQRLGVPYMNANGSMRDPGAIATDLAAVLQRQFPNDAAARTYWAQQAGEQGGMLTAVVAGPQQAGNAAKDLAKATQDQKGLTEKVIDSQVNLYQSMVSLQSTLAANVAPALANVTPALTDLTNAITNDIGPIVKMFATSAQGYKNIYDQAAVAAGKFSAFAHASNDVAWNAGTAVENFFRRPRGIRNNNPLNIKATGNQARDAQGFAMFPTMREGFEAAEGQLDRYGSRGLNTISSIISKWASGDPQATIQSYIKTVSGAMGKSANAPLTGADYPALIAAMTRVEDQWKISPSDVSSMLAPPNVSAAARGMIRTPPSPGVARSGGSAAAPNTTSMAGGQSMSLQIGSMTINTQATDANSIAANINAALRRKMLVANADVGLA